MKLNYCSNCGAKISNNARFCGECGQKIISLDEQIEINQNQCPNCSYTSKGDEIYCPDCGTALIKIVRDKKPELKPQPQPVAKTSKPVSKTKVPPSVKQKKGGILRTLGKVALGIFGILIALTTIFYFIGDEPESPNTNEPAPSTLTDIVFNPEPVIGSGTKAFEIEPITGVVLKAKQGALDKNRDFQVAKLTDNQVKEIAENLTGITAVPLKGISIDSGMEDGEIFPGTLEVELSLSEFNIPASMAAYLCIIRIESDGTSSIIPSTTENGQISFETERNSIFLFGIVKAVITGFAIGSAGISIHDSFKKKGYLRGDYSFDFSNWSKGFSEINDINGYTLYYPARMQQPNPTEVKRVEAIIIDIFKKHNLPGTNVNEIMKSPDFWLKIWPTLQRDKDFLDVQKLLKDEQWKQDNLWPKEVTEIVKKIREADAYLFGDEDTPGRGFKRYSNLDIIAFDKWPFEKDVPAQCINTYSKQPYVQVNLEGAPNPASSAMKYWTDNMLTNLVHEIFHSCQVRHLGTVSHDWEKYTWFWEATAVAVEKQAREYFEDHKIIAEEEMIISQQNSNYCQKNLAFVNGYKDPKDLQNQGYAYAPLIEYISNHYAAKTGKPKEKYINYILEKFVELRDARATLVKTTSRSNYGFEKLYKNYCHESLPSIISSYGHYQNAKKYPIPVAVNLTKEFPIYRIDNNYESMSMTMRKFNVLEADKTKDHSVKLVLGGIVDEVMSYADGFSIATTSSTGSKKYRALVQPSNMKTDEFDVEIGFGTVANRNKKKNSYSFYLQDVNYDMDNNVVNRTYEVFAMYKPATPSLTFDKFTEERWYLKIKYDESILKESGHVDSYRINLRCPNGDIYSFITEENEFEVPTSYDKQTLSESIDNIDFIHSIELKKADSKSTKTGDFRLFYRELTSSDAKVMGPQSTPIMLAVDAIVDLTANTNELSIDENINYEVTVKPDKSNYRYDWFMDGRAVQKDGKKLQFTFKEVGTYTAKVTVSDKNGKNIGSDSWTCTVTDPEKELDTNADNSDIVRIFIKFEYEDYAGEIKELFRNENNLRKADHSEETIAKRGNKIIAKVTSKSETVDDFYNQGSSLRSDLSIEGIDNLNNSIDLSFQHNVDNWALIGKGEPREYMYHNIREKTIRLKDVPFTKNIRPAYKGQSYIEFTFEGDLTDYIVEVKDRTSRNDDGGRVDYINYGSNCSIYLAITTKKIF